MAEDEDSLFIPETNDSHNTVAARRGPFQEDEDEEMDTGPEIINIGPFCICRGPEREGDWMVQCDASGCGAWFHGKCVNLSEKQDVWIKSYLCPKHSMRQLGRATFKMAEEMAKEVAEDIEEEMAQDEEPERLGIKEQLLASTGGLGLPAPEEKQVGSTQAPVKSTARKLSIQTKKAAREHNPMFVDSESDVSNYSPEDVADSESEADFEMVPEPSMVTELAPRQSHERNDTPIQTHGEIREGDFASLDLRGLKAVYTEDGLAYERYRVYSEEEIEQTEAYKLVRRAMEKAIMLEV